MSKSTFNGNSILGLALACALGSSTIVCQAATQAATCGATTTPIRCSTEATVDDADAWETEVKQKLDAGDIDGVMALCESAIQADPKNSKALYFRALANYINNQPLLTVLADLNKALEVDPKYVDALLGRGYINKAMHEFEAAIADFSTVLAIDPRHDQALEARIAIHTDLGDVEGMVDDFTHRISVAPADADAFYDRARCYKYLGKNDLAIADLKKAGELYLAQGRDEDFEKAQSLIASLQSESTTG